jgi:L-alanine-DL-glutamate epimerase-like enolase superfamily enzyme
LTIDRPQLEAVAMPEIATIEVRAIAPEVERFRYTAFEPEVFTTTTLVRIVDRDGVTGAGAYDSDSFGDWDLAPLETLRTIVPRLLGIDADDRDRVRSILTEDRTSPFPPAVRSTIDIALWDLAGRRLGRPLRELIAGTSTRSSLPSYASLALQDDEDAFIDAILGLTREGYAAVKVHAWGEPARDAALLRRVRDTFPDLIVMHDAEGRYDEDGAEVVARACADIGARWLEGPLPDLFLDGYRRLRRRVPDVPVIAAGDALWDARLIAEALRDPPWDAMRFDVSFAGGPTAARELMEVAEGAGMPVELISYGHTLIQAVNLQVALAFDRTSFFEQPIPPEPYEHGVVHRIRTGDDGIARVPDGPGLGVDLDPAALDRATIGVVAAGG